ncbi:MAG TPA: hypothetical protein VK920_01885 [Solirubrobacterales bacterium]|nr:hypothetical protein [Solirubrobacterales bacterium]
MLGRANAPRLATGLLAAGTLALAACGGSDDDTDASQAAPDAASFPSPDGRALQQFLSQEADAEGPVLSPAGQVFHKGENRYAFGVFTTGGDQIDDAEVALYAARGADGEAEGPYPARVESLEVEPQFESETSADDPDTARTVYVADVPMNADGEWRIGALVRDGDTLEGTLAPSAVVGRFTDVPQEGDKAPRVHTPTAEEVGGDLAKIDTRVPPDTMHEDDLADVLGEEPVVLVFATPALCKSRVCGPTADVAEQMKSEYGDEVSFIHMEIYEDNQFDKGLRPQVEAYNLPTEPWVFVIDENGRVAEPIEGAASPEALERAIQKVTG